MVLQVFYIHCCLYNIYSLILFEFYFCSIVWLHEYAERSAVGKCKCGCWCTRRFWCFIFDSVPETRVQCFRHLLRCTSSPRVCSSQYRLEHKTPKFEKLFTIISLPFSSLLLGTCSATLKFTVKDCDPTTGQPDSDDGYEDDYVVNIGFIISKFKNNNKISYNV